MRPTDTVDRLAALLRERGVDLREDGGEFSGDGDDAGAAWEAFKQMASEAAYDFFDNDHAVEHELLQFEASPSDGWRRYDGTEIPPQYWISVLRQFSGGQENEGLFGPELTIRFPLDPDSPLRSLSASEFGEPKGGGPLLPSGFAAGWLAEVETLDAFSVPTATKKASGFSFGIRQIG